MTSDATEAARAVGRPRARAAAAFTVVALACAVYANSLSNGFAFDDVPIIVEDERVHGAGDLLETLVGPYWPGISPAQSPYRPVTSASLALNWELGGGSPATFHAVNVLLHAAATLLLFLLLVRLGAADPHALVGAAIFAVHPVHTEAVANVIGRGDVFVAVFSLAALLVHRSSFRLRGLRTALVLFFYALALGAKENGIMLPALLLLVAAFDWREGDRPRAFLAREAGLVAGIVVVTAAYLWLRFRALGVLGTDDVPGYIKALAPATRIATGIRIWPEYARLLLLPRDLVVHYGPAVIMPVGWGDARVFLGALIALGSLALAAASWRRNRWVSLAVLWFALTIFPVTNLVLPVAVWLAERTLYLPSVGLSILVAGLLGRLPPLPAPRRALLVAAGTLVLVAGATRTWTRNPTWRSDDTVFGNLAREHPEAFHAQWWLGGQLLARGEVDRALEYLRRSYELSGSRGWLQQRYVEVLLQHGRTKEAERVLYEFPLREPLRYTYLTNCLMMQGRYAEAARVIGEGAALLPQNEYVQLHRYLLMSQIHLLTGQPAAARDMAAEGLRRWPDNAYLRRNLAPTLAQLERAGYPLPPARKTGT